MVTIHDTTYGETERFQVQLSLASWLTHSELSIHRDEGVRQHNEERPPEVGVVSDGRPLLLGGGEGEEDTAQLVDDVPRVDVQLLTAVGRMK